MELMAKVIRVIKDEEMQDAIVNPAQVRYVYAKNPLRSYIAFSEGHKPEERAVTPLGIEVNHSLKDVKKLLHRPYWIDFWLKVGALILSAGIVAATIWVGK